MRAAERVILGVSRRLNLAIDALTLPLGSTPVIGRESRAKTALRESLTLKKSRFTKHQIVGILKEGEAGAKPQIVPKTCVSPATYYAWKSKFVGVPCSVALSLRLVLQRTPLALTR